MGTSSHSDACEDTIDVSEDDVAASLLFEGLQGDKSWVFTWNDGILYKESEGIVSSHSMHQVGELLQHVNEIANLEALQITYIWNVQYNKWSDIFRMRRFLVNEIENLFINEKPLLEWIQQQNPCKRFPHWLLAKAQ